MKKLILTRTSRQEGFTTGVLYVDGKLMCHTLEPQWRNLPYEKKVMGMTAIPEGTYTIRLSPSVKFHRLMPYLLDVPHFTGIMCHPGNKVEDTHGCILVGERNKPDTLKNSRLTFNRLYALLEDFVKAGEEIIITIQ
ncbi:DUF5675 family protein [Bacteroides sp. CR5/BHMF/2]|nr:DUF5675 family protein [Bacteroides sp. CR5/BHMF/2]